MTWLLGADLEGLSKEGIATSRERIRHRRGKMAVRQIT